MYNKCPQHTSGAFTFIYGSLLFGNSLFGVSEPRLTKKPPLMNPKNHKYHWSILLYTINEYKSMCILLISLLILLLKQQVHLNHSSLHTFYPNKRLQNHVTLFRLITYTN